MLFFVTAYEQKSVMLDSQAGFSHRHHSLPLLPMSTTERPQSGGGPYAFKNEVRRSCLPEHRSLTAAARSETS